MTDRGLHQGLSHGERLRKRSDFLRAQEHGLRYAGRYLVVYALSAPASPTKARLGITASRKVGKAVVRNRVKRWVRESYRRLAARGSLAADVVVIARPSAATTTFQGVDGELRNLLARMRTHEGNVDPGR